MDNLKPTKTTYCPDDIRKAAQLYVLSGNLRKVSRDTGIPHSTMVRWKNGREEWRETCIQVRTEKDAELNAHFTAIIDKAMGELEERLMNGDEFYDPRKGGYYRKRVGARDLAIIFAVSYDKRQLLRNAPTSITGNAPKDTEQKLQELGRILEQGVDSLIDPPFFPGLKEAK